MCQELNLYQHLLVSNISYERELIRVYLFPSMSFCIAVSRSFLLVSVIVISQYASQK